MAHLDIGYRILHWTSKQTLPNNNACHRIAYEKVLCIILPAAVIAAH